MASGNSARRRRGRPKGTPKTGGRKKGTPNKATVEAKLACSEIIDDPAYRFKLLSRARAGKLAPAVECMLWHYAKGKPKETIEHQTEDGKPLPLHVFFGGRYRPQEAGA